MYSPLRLAGKYLHYYLTAANGKGHGIHSPFVFDFVTKVLNDRYRYPAYDRIEDLRRRLCNDPTLLEIEDFGAGSAWNSFSTRTVSSLVRHAAKPPHLGQLLFRVARHYQPATILELGTSLGISTAYLAAGAPQSRLHTIEGAPAVAAKAKTNLRALDIDADLITGNFDTVLPSLLTTIPPVGLAFVDGNHRLEPTLGYFDLLARRAAHPSILIFDDIHWSSEMETAWTAIKNDPRVYLTIDLFFIGFVFFREEFKIKQHFTIRF